MLSLLMCRYYCRLCRFTGFSCHYLCVIPSLCHLAWSSLGATAASQATAMFSAVTGPVAVVGPLDTDPVYLCVTGLATRSAPGRRAGRRHRQRQLTSSAGFNCSFTVPSYNLCLPESAVMKPTWRHAGDHTWSWNWHFMCHSHGMTQAVGLHVSIDCDQLALMWSIGRAHESLMICRSITAVSACSWWQTSS